MGAPLARRLGPVLLGPALLGLVLAAAACARAPEPVTLALDAGSASVLCPRGFEAVQEEAALLFRDGPVLVELRYMGAPGHEPDPEATLDDWVRWGLGWLDSSKQREVAERRGLDVQGRASALVETRDTLTHAQRRRFAFVVDAGTLLVLHTRGGDYEAATAAFDVLLESLRLEP